ncbi:RidA family protein [Streptosporangium amethystogenes]|uniref:RidA family protein n=1 Tax=Streptosporangium amethystogenes TaxID=2002 RepID=UPI001FDF4239|nr:RidA family protein [Streptosporangium amethystogenes]
MAIISPGSRLVWTSGQVPIAADGTVAPAGDWEAQTRLAMQNVGAALEGGGATWNDVFKLTIYVVDTSALPVVRMVRDEFVSVDRPPTSSLVRVAGLFRPDILIEIEAVAAVGG